MASQTFKKDRDGFWVKFIALSRRKDAASFFKKKERDADEKKKEENQLANFVRNIKTNPAGKKMENRYQPPDNLPDDLKEFVKLTNNDKMDRLYEQKGWEFPDYNPGKHTNKKPNRDEKTLIQYKDEKTKVTNKIREAIDNGFDKTKVKELRDTLRNIQLSINAQQKVEQITIPKREMNDFIYFMRLVFPDEYRKTYPGLTKLLDGLFKCGKTNNLLRRKGQAKVQFKKEKCKEFDIISFYILEEIEASIEIIFAFEVSDIWESGFEIEKFMKDRYEKSRCYDDKELFNFSKEFDTTKPEWMEQIKTWVVEQEFAYDNKIYEGEELKNFMGEEEE